MGWSKDHGTAAKVNAEYAKEQGNVAKQEATNLAELKSSVEAATQNASAATENANAVIEDANTAASNADSAASEAIAQANHAKNEGDRAKAEADRLVGTDVSKLDNKITEVTTQLAENVQQINRINAPKITPIEIIAHRGFAGLAPENTMSAFSLASSFGSLSLECDVQMTSDGIPVVIHDSTVDRTTNGTGSIKNMTLAQLQSLDAGSKFSPFYSGTKIPTFDEFLKYAKGRSIRVYPEIKDIRSISDIEVMVNVIKNNNMENVTVIQSFNLDHLLEVRKFSKTIKLGLLIYNTALTQYTIDSLSDDGNAMVLYGYSYVISNPSIVNQYYDLGIDLGVWVVPNRDVSDWLLGLGVTKQMFDLYFGGIA
ncbi:glycerophosphodiester phosphodiesterase [Solibacillus silvestris]